MESVSCRSERRALLQLAYFGSSTKELVYCDGTHFITYRHSSLSFSGYLSSVNC